MKAATRFAKHVVIGSRGGRVTKWRGKVASVAPGLVVASVMGLVVGADPASSQTISGPVTTTQTVAADGDLTVTPSGSVTVTGATGATGIEFVRDYLGSFINQGTVSAEVTASDGSDDALALYFMGPLNGASVSNAGNISATAMGGTTGSDVSVIARGIYIQGDLTTGTVFTGTGNITVNATGGNAESDAVEVRTSVEDTYGIFVGGWVSGASFFSQSGDVSLTAVGGSGGSFSANTRINEVAGIRIGRIRDSLIELSGDVRVDVRAGDSESQESQFSNSSVKEVAGVWFYEAIENQSSVSNSGNITVIGQAGDGAGDGSASLQVEDVGAIVMRGNVSTSGFENRGGLSVVVKGGAEAVGSKGRKNTDVENAAGILLDRSNISNGSTLTNSGDISVLAESGATTGNARVRYVGGIQFFEGNIDTGSALINSGDISVDARAAAGGTLANTQIIAGISLTSGVLQGRVVADQVDYAELVNSGNITVSAHAGESTGFDNFDSADASALNTAGIFIGRDVFSANLINSGSFNVSSAGGTANGGLDGNANADASAFGIRVAQDLESTSVQPNTGSTLSNSGNMVVTAKGGVAQARGAGESRASASAYGISIGGTITEDSSFVNSGDITALATAGNATGSTRFQDANAYAVYLGSITKTEIEEGVFTAGTFTSTGNLTGRAFGDSGVGAGLWVNGDMNGQVDLRGVIKGVGPTENPEDSYAIYFGGGNGALNITAPTWFVGSLMIADQSVTLTSGRPHSVHWVFDYGAGATFNLIEGDGIPWFSRNGDTQSGEYATFDPSGQALQDQAIAGIASFGDKRMRRSLADDAAHRAAWVEMSGGTDEFEGDGAVNDFDIKNTGGVAGITLQASKNLGFGLMAGAVSSDASADGLVTSTQSLDATSVLFGAAVATRLNGLMLDGGLKVGSTEMDSSRFLNYNLAIPQHGLENAEASFDSKWGRVSLGASYDFAVGGGLTITPAAYLAYTRADIDGYAEVGATANASVGSRSVDLTDVEVAMNFSQQIGLGVLFGSVGYVSRSADGPNSIDVTLIGDQKSVGLANADYEAAKLGLGYSYKAGENLSFDIEGTLLEGKSWQSQNLWGGFTLRF